MNKKIFINLFMIFVLVASAKTNAKNSPATYQQYSAAVQATQTPMPINDMYKVRKKVVNTQNQYQKARELQYKNSQMYNDLLK